MKNKKIQIILFLAVGLIAYFVLKKKELRNSQLPNKPGEISDVVTGAKQNFLSAETVQNSEPIRQYLKEKILDKSFDNPHGLLKSISGSDIEVIASALSVLNEIPKATEGSEQLRDYDQNAIRALTLIKALVEKSQIILNQDELQIIEDISAQRPNNQIKFTALEIFLKQKNSSIDHAVKKILFSSEGAGAQLLMRLLLSHTKNKSIEEAYLVQSMNQMVKQRSAAHALSIISAIQPNDLSRESLTQLSQSACQNANLKIDRTLSKKIRTKLNLLAEAQAMQLQPCQ